MNKSCHIGASVVVIDSFHSDPQAIVDTVASRSFHRTGAYQGRDTEIDFQNRDWYAYRFEQALGIKVEQRSLSRHYRVSLQNDFPNNSVHVDIELQGPEKYLAQPKWMGVVYLGTRGEGSLRFFRHKDTGTLRYISQNQMPTTHFYDLAHWEIVDSISTLYNRAIFFNASLFHGPGLPLGYGKGPQDGRLIEILAVLQKA